MEIAGSAMVNEGFSKQRPRDERHAATELVALFDDGREERSIVRRASARRKIREFEGMPGFLSVTIARTLSIEEWESLCAESPARRQPPRRVSTPPLVEGASTAAAGG